MDEETKPTRRSRRTIFLLVAPIVALVIASNVGDALAPTLVDTHPLLLLALNARNRHLVLVTNQLDALPYYGVGALRLVLSDPLFFVLGRRYGESVVAWVERKSPTNYGPMLRLVERFFSKASYPLVFIAPNNYVCLFAGASGINPVTFLTLNVAGTVARLYLIRRVGETFDAPIDSVLDFIGRYRLQLLILSIASVLFTVWNDRRHGRSEIEAITELEDDLTDSADSADPAAADEPSRLDPPASAR